MPTTPLSRRTFGTATGAWAASSVQPALGAPRTYRPETDVWTGSVLWDQDGRSFVLGELQRPLTLLKLWAGWCPACAAEMPQLSAMASSMGRTIEVILISHPQYWAADQVAARRRGLPFRLATFAPSTSTALMEQALLGQGRMYSVPRSLVFRERDHSIVMTRDSSTDWGADSMLKQVRALTA